MTKKLKRPMRKIVDIAQPTVSYGWHRYLLSCHHYIGADYPPLHAGMGVRTFARCEHCPPK